MKTVCVKYKGFTISAPICEHRPDYSNFLVTESMLKEGIICFEWRDKCRRIVRKAIPVMHIIDDAKRRSFRKYDEEEEKYKYCGYGYLLKDYVVFNYAG